MTLAPSAMRKISSNPRAGPWERLEQPRRHRGLIIDSSGVLDRQVLLERSWGEEKATLEKETWINPSFFTSLPHFPAFRFTVVLYGLRMFLCVHVWCRPRDISAVAASILPSLTLGSLQELARLRSRETTLMQQLKQAIAETPKIEESALERRWDAELTFGHGMTLKLTKLNCPNVDTHGSLDFYLPNLSNYMIYTCRFFGRRNTDLEVLHLHLRRRESPAFSWARLLRGSSWQARLVSCPGHLPWPFGFQVMPHLVAWYISRYLKVLKLLEDLEAWHDRGQTMDHVSIASLLTSFNNVIEPFVSSPQLGVGV